MFQNEAYLRRSLQKTKSKSKKEPEIKCYPYQEWILDGFRYWVEGIGIIVVGITGILGNMISIHILRKETMQKNSFDKLITHLIVIDTLLVIFFVIDAFTENIIGYEPQYYKILYPYVLHPGKAISLSSSIFMVVVVAADRQRAICHPMLYRVSIFRDFRFRLLYLMKVCNFVFFL